MATRIESLTYMHKSANQLSVEVCLDLVGKKAAPTDTGDAGGNVVDSQYRDCQGNQVTRGNRLHVVQRNLFTVHSAQR